MSVASRLQSSIYNALETRRVPGPEVPPTRHVRASGIGDCARKQTYRMRETGIAVPRPGSYYGILQADQGNWIEDGMVPLLQVAGYVIEQQQKELDHIVDGELIVRGHIDGLIREDAGALETPWHLWECKGMSAYRFRKLNTGGSVMKAEPGYYDQAQVYMTLLNNELDVRSCLFTAIAKDPSSVNNWQNKNGFTEPIYVEEIPWDPQAGERLLMRAAMLYETATVNGQYGERERNPFKDWDCSARFCEYYEQCDPKRNWRKEQAA